MLRARAPGGSGGAGGVAEGQETLERSDPKVLVEPARPLEGLGSEPESQ